jgi:hypothetical protein
MQPHITSQPHDHAFLRTDAKTGEVIGVVGTEIGPSDELVRLQIRTFSPSDTPQAQCSRQPCMDLDKILGRIVGQ